MGGQLGEEGEDDDEGEDPPGGGEEPGGVSPGGVGGGPARGEIPGGVRHQERAVVRRGPGEESEEEAGEEVEEEDQRPDSSRVRAEPGAGPEGLGERVLQETSRGIIQTRQHTAFKLNC